MPESSTRDSSVMSHQLAVISVPCRLPAVPLDYIHLLSLPHVIHAQDAGK